MKVIKNAGHQDWRTPPWLYQRLHDRYDFQVDAAATLYNALCPKHISPTMDATNRRTWQAWVRRGYTRYFLNPPFNDIAPFLVPACDAGYQGAIVVCLLPARVEVEWAHDIVYPYAHEITFVRGRVRYYRSIRNGKPNFPSMVVRFGPGPRKGPIILSTIAR